MTDEEYMRATKDGNVPMNKREIEQLLAERENNKTAPKIRTLEERIIELEQRVAKLEK